MAKPKATKDVTDTPARLDGRIISIPLAGVEYEVKQLSIGQAKAWRQKISEPLTSLVSGLRNAGEVELNDLTSIAGLLNLVVDTVAGSVDLISNFVFDYSPDVLGADKKRILNEAYDDEMQAAFIAILEVSYPFGRLLTLVQSVQKSGAEATKTGRRRR